VESAQASRPPVQKLVDRVAAVFVPVVLVIGGITFFFWYLWLPEDALMTALVRLVAVLVIACPCAMGLATPTAIVVGTGRGAELGILFRSGLALERAQRLDTVVLDKTGTLTQGRPSVTDIVVASSSEEEDVLRLAGSLERGSEHPLATAIVKYVESRLGDVQDPDEMISVEGRGVRGRVGGQEVLVGGEELLRQNGIDLDDLASDAKRLAAEARTLVYVAFDGELKGILGLLDIVREEAVEAVQELQRMSLSVALVTGDHESTARVIGREVGIDELRAEVRPLQKAEYVAQLQREAMHVAMVGDGINDAPALARADVGIAMGSGTDVAMETADVTLMRGDLRGVPQAIRLSRRTMRTIRENLFWAFGYNVVLIPVAAGVLYPFVWLPDVLRELHPILAALAMAFSSVSVVTNSLRLKRASL
jgi:Cu+-exporting ATPase